MSGTPHGRHSIYLPPSPLSTEDAAKTHFVAIIKALDAIAASGNCARIASFYGSGGTGFEYPDSGLGSPGNTAFVVYRWGTSTGKPFSWYLLVQYAYGSTFNTAGNGQPALYQGGNGITSACCVGFSVAVAFDQFGTSVSPWKGTVLDDGTDTKANPVWDVPTGHLDERLSVWPRSNNPGGSHATARQNLTTFYQATSTTLNSVETLLFLVADADSMFITSDVYCNGTIDTIAFVTPISVIAELEAPSQASLYAMGSNTPYNLLNAAMPNATAGTGDPNGGVFSPLLEYPVAGIVYTRSPDTSNVSPYQPTKQAETRKNILFPFAVYADETPNKGFVGYAWPFIQYSQLVPAYATLDNKLKVSLSTGLSRTGGGMLNFIVPWDGVTADPSSGRTREGVTF